MQTAETKRGTVTTTEPSRAQALIARRMAEVKATVPTYAATANLVLTGESLEQGERFSQERFDLLVAQVVKTLSELLPKHPRINGAWRDGKIEGYSKANVGLAVDLRGETILLPVVAVDLDKDALQVVEQIASLRERADADKLTAPDMAAVTFAVVEAGPNGAHQLEAIMPTGNAACLTIGSPQLQPVVSDGQVQPGWIVSLTVVADHRLVYPSHVSAFVGDLVEKVASLRR